MLKGKPKQNTRGSIKRSKCVKKDYQQKSLNNPFFRRRKQNHKSGHKFKRLYFFGFIFLLLICLSLFYLFFISNNFLIQKIEVNGLTRSSDEKLVEMAWAQSEESKLIFLKQINLFCFDANKLQDNLNNNFSFAHLSVKKKWPHTVTINVEERSLAFIWKDSDQAVFSDSEGCLVSEISPNLDDFKKYPVLSPVIKDEYITKNNCLNFDQDYLSSLLNLDSKIRLYDKLLVRDYTLESEFNTITANLELGPKVYFNVKNELDKQVKKLAVIEHEKPEAEFKVLEYIDLRYGDRVYFK